MTAWRERTAFRDLLAADPDVMAQLSLEELDACFDAAWYLRNISTIYRRVGLA
jgi:adenylosuccinate lyase